MTHKFDDLCLPHRPALHSRAMQLAGEPQAAADLVQDAYVRALTFWSSFRVEPGEDPSERARAWLYRILTNEFISHRRSLTRQTEMIQSNRLAISEATAGGVCNVYRTTSDSDEQQYELACEQPEKRLSQAVQRALAELDPVVREIVVRADILGETYQEISEGMGIEWNGTMHSRLHRARKKLAEILVRLDERARIDLAFGAVG